MSSDKKEEGAGAPLSPDVDEDESTGYKPPAEKSLAEILSTDKEDESLARYRFNAIVLTCIYHLVG